MAWQGTVPVGKENQNFSLTPAQHPLRGLRFPSSPGSVPPRPGTQKDHPFVFRQFLVLSQNRLQAGYAGFVDIDRKRSQKLLVCHGRQLLSVLDMRE